MELGLNKVINKIKQNNFVENFIEELGKTLERYNNKNNFKPKGEDVNDFELTPDEELEFNRREFSFLQNYFTEELSNLDKGETFIVTDKYEDDTEYHRYKVAQYKDNKECKYIAFEKDLPENVGLGNIVRKVEGKYIYDEQATRICKEFN